MKKIYLVEDDTNLGYILKEYLELHDFKVQLEINGQTAIDHFTDADICILDLMLPLRDGFEVAKHIRNISKKIPLLFLTAKSLKVDKLKAFKLGADDYLVKPVDEEELIARIHAILKRSTQTNQEVYSIGNYTFDHSNQILQVDHNIQRLTERESLILAELCKNKNQIVSRDETLKKIWGDNDYFNRRSMDVFISKLRQYLSRDKSIEIKNIHGKGFVLIC